MRNTEVREKKWTCAYLICVELSKNLTLGSLFKQLFSNKMMVTWGFIDLQDKQQWELCL